MRVLKTGQIYLVNHERRETNWESPEKTETVVQSAAIPVTEPAVTTPPVAAKERRPDEQQMTLDAILSGEERESSGPIRGIKVT